MWRPSSPAVHQDQGGIGPATSARLAFGRRAGIPANSHYRPASTHKVAPPQRLAERARLGSLGQSAEKRSRRGRRLRRTQDARPNPPPHPPRIRLEPREPLAQHRLLARHDKPVERHPHQRHQHDPPIETEREHHPREHQQQPEVNGLRDHSNGPAVTSTDAPAPARVEFPAEASARAAPASIANPTTATTTPTQFTRLSQCASGNTRTGTTQSSSTASAIPNAANESGGHEVVGGSLVRSTSAFARWETPALKQDSISRHDPPPRPRGEAGEGGPAPAGWPNEPA